jgi:predicted RNA-binding protein with PUA-like domain
MRHWLVKSDPGTYGWSDLVRDGRTSWDGVRSYAARIHLRAMKPGDLVLFYHSAEERSVVGIMKTLSEPYRDTTSEEETWSAIDVAPVAKLRTPVPLSKIKTVPSLQSIRLLREGRLSVMPLEKEEFETIVALGGGTA